MTSDFYKRPLLVILIIYALCLAVFLPVPKPKAGDVSHLIKPNPQSIVLKVISYPETKKGRQIFRAEVLNVEGVPSTGRSYVYCNNCSELSLGERVTLKGIIEPVFSTVNYGSFNWPEYLARRHIFCQIQADGIISADNDSAVWGVLSKIRGSMLKVFNDNLPPHLAAILGGIAIGEKGDIGPGLLTAFQDSGAIHLLVASGGNVGFVTLIVYFLCSLFFMGRYFPAAAALSAALLYTLIAGADAPLIRAYIMTCAATLGLLLGRKSGILQGFLIAALLILIFNAQSVFDAGFQMSFLATLSIIYFACNFDFIKRMPKTAAWAAGLFFVSLSAQLALVPVFTNYFNKISFAAIISNIFLVPLSGVIMGGAFVLWFTSFLPFTFIFKAVLFIIKILLAVFNFLVEAFANTPLSSLTVSSWNFSFVVAYYVGLFGLFNFPLFKNKKRFVCISLIIVLCFVTGGILIKNDIDTVLMGRYNNSIFIKEGGKIIVIGAGVEPKILKSAVLASGRKSIDCLFVNSIYKGASYGLKDISGIRIKNIYLPAGDVAPETKELAENSGALISYVKPDDEYCGVKVSKPWYPVNGGGIRESDKLTNLSFSYGGYEVSGNVKSYKKGGELFLYN